MNLIYKLNGTTLTDRVQFLPDGGTAPSLVTAAERGSQGQSGVLIEDGSGNLTFNGWGVFTVEDTDATPNRIYKGIVVDRSIGRDETFYTGSGRVYDCDLYDLNQLLHWLTPLDNAAKRPSETDVARVAWLLTDRALADIEVGGGLMPIEDLGLVDGTPATALFEADTRRQYPDEILRECAEPGGKNFFVYDDLATNQVGLFYDSDDASVWAAGISISNVASEINDTTVFGPSDDLNTERSANDVYQSMSLGYQGDDPVFVESAAIETAFGFNRQAVMDMPRIGRRETALAVAAARLNYGATEPDVITTTIYVPSSKLNEVLAGQEIDVKLTHIPRYSSGLTGRIRRKSYTPFTPNIWSVQLEIWFPPTPADDAAEPDPPCDTDIADTATFTSSGDQGTDGSFDAALQPANPTNVNDADEATHSVRSAIVGGVGGEDRTYRSHWIADFGSAVAVGSMEVLSLWPSGTAPTHIYYSTTGLAGSWTDASATVTWHANGWTITFAEQTKRYWRITTSQSGSGLFYIPELGLTEIAIYGCEQPETPLPATGEEIADTSSVPIPDGTTSAFTTQFPYVDGTLVYILDGIDQTLAVTETDPETGAYDLAFVPEVGERPIVRYVSR